MIKQVIFNFDKINYDEYILSINNHSKNDTNNFWYKYQIICSISDTKNKLLKSEDMILIPSKLKSDILNNKKFKEFNKKILEKELDKIKNKYKDKYIDILSENTGDHIIYYVLTKIIKT
jgi:hypothetical protein